MRILLDNNLDHRLGRLLVGHEVTPARRMGRSELKNGELIASGEHAGFDVLITGDKNLQYQQNLTGRRISIVTLNSLFIDLKGVAPLVPELLEVLQTLESGAFVTISAS